MRNIFQSDKVALVQRPVYGKDYRIVVLDDKVISAYQRIPLNVVGDGIRSIGELLARKQKEFVKSGRDTIIRPEDARIAQNLMHQGRTKRSVPKLGEVVYLLDNANLSTGGDSVDVTSEMHQEFKKLAIRLTKDMGLRMCGVDLMVANAKGGQVGDISKAPKKYWVLEINAAPGLDHYVKTGKAQEKIVEDMYLQVLKAME
jgi:D-alanine-D-alanine ligase-like ATP-grasp enzyme